MNEFIALRLEKDAKRRPTGAAPGKTGERREEWSRKDGRKVKRKRREESNGGGLRNEESRVEKARGL